MSIDLGLKILNTDITYGTSREDAVIEKVSAFFGETVTKVQYQYSPYDAVSDTTKYEIKSRRNRYAQYPTTIVACNKIRTEGRLVFIFHFTDGLYYIVYDKEKFSKYEVRDVWAVRSGGNRTCTPHFHINIEDLTQMIL